jgi:hypothetical protein
VRRDAHVPPLQPLYDGPYTVLRRSLHHFMLRIGDKEDKVSTLRLEPCGGIITATSQAKLSTPPRHYCACVGANSYVFLCFPTVNPPS